MELNDYFDLGVYTRPITTRSEKAQTWFNRGLIWSYGFNHEESAACFEKAITDDEGCGMAYWGLAYALGPNYNKPWEFFDGPELADVLRRTHHAASKAQELSGAASGVERALIGALRYRYQAEDADGPAQCSIWNQKYSDAMADVYNQNPGDLDIAALYADSLMNLTPWALWDLRTGDVAAGAKTIEAKEVLSRAMEQPGGSDHPGLLHLYIHLMEMSSSPESAIPLADRLRGLVPDAGHLNHMPTHLDVLCGDWLRAIASNSEAIEADERFLAWRGAKNFYTLYRSHDYHFKIYAALFAGQRQTALETCARLEASMPEELLRVETPPMADWLEGFLAMRLHTLVRFGMWEEILDLVDPPDQDLYCTTTTMTHYGRGIAYANLDRMDEALHSKRAFIEAVAKVPSSRTLFNNTCKDILQVAGAMLEGELEYRQGNTAVGFEQIERAIVLSDNLPYDEPWGWMHPPRHAYGALLLEESDRLNNASGYKMDRDALRYVEAAADAYAADLGLNETLPRALRHPNNIWALRGYHECISRLGRSPHGQSLEEIQRQVDRAALDTDVSIVHSCFCRKPVQR